MQLSQNIKCDTFPCADVNHASYILPGIEIIPENIFIILISESATADTADYYYAPGNPLFQQTTIQAFQDAGIKVSTIQDILHLGVYLTTALQAGPSYFIEQSKRRMIASDIAAALRLARS